ncbi:nuclear transport factor 2 family protein [Amedibacillus sp. YH-ame10]
MNYELMIENYWKDTLAQDGESMRLYFEDDAYVNWHNTNEHFTMEEYICANCEYPNKWAGKIERMQCLERQVITVTHVYTKDNTMSFHVTSFFIMSNNGLIQSIDEYWGEDGIPPKWRLDKHIGTKIKDV